MIPVCTRAREPHRLARGRHRASVEQEGTACGSPSSAPAPWGAGPSRSWASARRSTRSSSATSTRSRRARSPPCTAATRRAPSSSTPATRQSVEGVIAGCDAMINATQHFWNITVMHAAAASGVHYTDMGGLFHVTRQQVELDEEFKKAGVTAVVAMGGAPGVTNILARYGAERLDTIEEAHAFCGNVDDTDWSRYGGWVVPVLARDLVRRVQRVGPAVHRRPLERGHRRRRGTRRRRLRRAGRHPRGASHHPLRAHHLLARLEGQGPAVGDLPPVPCRASSRSRCASSTASA